MPKNISNPDSFQIEAAAILAAAYETFPMTFAWSHDEDTEEYPTSKGNSREEIQFQTIRWLVTNGYLYDEGGFVGGQWQGLGLAERGLAALNSVPDALSGQEPVGKRLVSAVAKGSVELIKQLIPVAIQQAMGG
jgi:hypothetical protein